MRELFAFPNPVNEKAARVVAGVVLVTVVVILLTGAYWLTIPLAYGFWARVLTGPTLSPLGWAAQNVVAPRLGPKRPVSGPPKRFAQGMGAVMASAALILGLVAGAHTAADVVLGLFVVAAGLESIFGYCLGCRVFGLLMRAGLVPASVCEECADIRPRLQRAASSTRASAEPRGTRLGRARGRARGSRAPAAAPGRRGSRPRQPSAERERGSAQDVVL